MNQAALADSSENNPYRSPLATNEPVALGNAGNRRVFRWCIIPVAILYFYAAFMIVRAAVGTILLGIWAKIFILRGRCPPVSSVAMVLIGAIGAAILAALLICAAKNFWRRRWLRGIVESLVAVVLFAVLGGRIGGFGS